MLRIALGSDMASGGMKYKASSNLDRCECMKLSFAHIWLLPCSNFIAVWHQATSTARRVWWISYTARGAFITIAIYPKNWRGSRKYVTSPSYASRIFPPVELSSFYGASALSRLTRRLQKNPLKLARTRLSVHLYLTCPAAYSFTTDHSTTLK